MNSIETVVSQPLVSISNNRAITTSRNVADQFGKQHSHVLRSIEGLLSQLPQNHASNFGLMVIEVKIGSGAIRKDPAYEITRDGFTLLAMGFTGKKALQFKLAYIDAFNKMEAELTRISDASRIASKSESKKYSYPKELLLQDYFCGRDGSGRKELPKLDLLTFGNSKFESPLAALLKQLHDDGHNVDAPFAEFAAIQEGLKKLTEQLNAIANIGTSAGNSVLKMMNRQL